MCHGEIRCGFFVLVESDITIFAIHTRHFVFLAHLIKLKTLNLLIFRFLQNPLLHFSTVSASIRWYRATCKFKNCRILETVIISSSVTTIGDYAFQSCALKDIYNYAVQPQNISEYSRGYPFYSSPFSNYGATLHVPKGSKEAYENAGVWKKFTIVDDIVTTNVKTINVGEQSAEDAPIYDLQGRRVTQLESGKIYLRGKKFRQK